jgi:phage terminase large subunit-like protein
MVMPAPPTEKPGTTFDLFGKQHEFAILESAFSAFVGGVGSGKTYAGCIRAITYMASHPNSLGMITAPTHPMLRDSTRRTMRELLPPGLEKRNEKGQPDGWREGEGKLTLENGAECLFRSTDAAEHLRGVNLAWFYMDEAALGTPAQPDSQYSAFQILQARLRQHSYPHQGWLTTTPKGFNWVYQEFAKEKRDDYQFVTCAADENPYLPPDYIRRLRESYPEDFAGQEIEGRFVLVGGTNFFDQGVLQDMYHEAMPPKEVRVGGAVRIWHQPIKTRHYVAGADVAWGSTGAYCHLSLWDARTWVQAASIYGRLPSEEFAYEIVELCKQYNNAFVGVERNGEGGENVNALMVELGYGKRMFHKDWRSRHPDQPGWETRDSVGGGTRSYMLNELERAVRERDIVIREKETIDEMLTFVRDSNGKASKTQGARDDRVISTAIARQMLHYAKFVGSSSAPGPRSF